MPAVIPVSANFQINYDWRTACGIHQKISIAMQMQLGFALYGVMQQDKWWIGVEIQIAQKMQAPSLLLLFEETLLRNH